MYNTGFLQEKALAKLNLSFRILEKLPNGFHKIQSHVVFLPKIYDYLKIQENSTNTIELKGKYAKELLSLGGDTIINKTLERASSFLSIKIGLKIVLYKNIPLGAGLGGGSADAAAVFRLLLKIYDIKLSDKKIIKFLLQIGSDVPACYFSENMLLGGYGNKITKITNTKKKKWILVIKPLENFSTKSIFKKFNGPFSSPINFKYTLNNIIYDMKNKPNDLQSIGEKNKSYSNFLKSLPTQKSLIPPRMTGSGSTIFLIFDSYFNALECKKELVYKHANTWIKISYLYL